METKITVQNVVASASFKQPVDLNAIVTAFPEVEYRPQVFPALLFRLKSGKGVKILIVASGQTTGA